MSKGKVDGEKDFGVFIRIGDDYDKILQLIAGIERTTKAEVARSILQPGLQKRYDVWLQDFKKTL